jgi:hypothetical protein
MIGRVVARARSLWRGLSRRSTVEAEVDEEFRIHLEMRAEDLVRAGLSPEEARRRARIEFGGVERYKDEGRAARGLEVFDELRFSWLDVRLGARMLVRYPGLTVVGVFALAFRRLRALAGAGEVASIVPIRRALGVDPSEALRADG